MDLSTIDQGIATQIGHYADAIVIPAGYDQILVSGTPGLDQDGDLAPDIVGQSEQAWENVTRILNAAGASIGVRFPISSSRRLRSSTGPPCSTTTVTST